MSNEYVAEDMSKEYTRTEIVPIVRRVTNTQDIVDSHLRMQKFLKNLEDRPKLMDKVNNLNSNSMQVSVSGKAMDLERSNT